MKRSNFTFLFLFALLSFASVDLTGQACFDANVTLSVDCEADLSSLAVAPAGYEGTEVILNGVAYPATGSGAISVPAGLVNKTVSFEAHFQEIGGTETTFCWGDVSLEAKLTPTVDALCRYIPRATSSNSATVKDSMFVDRFDNKLPDTLELARMTISEECQLLEPSVRGTVKHYSILHYDPATGGPNPNWQYDEIYWEVRALNVDGTLGAVMTSGSGTADGSQLAGTAMTVPAGTYVVRATFIESANLTDYLTTDGPEGSVAVALSRTACYPDPECATWCPDDDEAPAQIMSASDIRAQLSGTCYADLEVNNPDYTYIGDICDVISGNYIPNAMGGATGSAALPANFQAKLVIVNHTGTVSGAHGDDQKVALGFQAYYVTAPTWTPMLPSVSVENVALECGDDSTPWDIYESIVDDQVAAYVAANGTITSAAYEAARDYAAQRSFPHIKSVHKTDRVRVPIPGGVTHCIVEKDSTIKVLKYYDSTSGTYNEVGCTPNDSDCIPVWVTETITVKTVEECPIPGGSVLVEVPKIYPGYDGELCDRSYKYQDMPFDACGGGEKLVRMWSYIDWCTGTVSDTEQQIILIKDTKGPDVVVSGDLTGGKALTIAPWTCYAELELEADVSDACAEVSSVQWIADGGAEIIGGNILRLWKGEYVNVNVIATDECGNVTEKSFAVEAVDKVDPVVITEDELNVTLTGGAEDIVLDGDSGVAKVLATSIDAGSHDAGCGDVDVCTIRKEDYDAGKVVAQAGRWNTRADGRGATIVRSSNGDLVIDGKVAYNAVNPCYANTYTEYEVDKFGIPTGFSWTYTYVTCDDYVKFCCADLDENVEVVLQATDDYGNSAIGWTSINVEDKSNAGWQCVYGEMLCTEIGIFEPVTPSYGGVVCKGFEVREVKREYDEVCGEGEMAITWAAYDDAGEEVSRTVCYYPIIQPEDFGFDPTTIKWPKHYDGTVYEGLNRECHFAFGLVQTNTDVYMGDAFSCEAGVVVDEPVWCETSCSLVLKSYEDQEVPENSSCGKILRRWTVIDWCTWEPNGDNVDDENDTDYDQFVAVEDWTLGTACEDCDQRSGQLDNVYFEYATTSDINGDKEYLVDVDGYYTFDQVIKILDETAPVITAEDVEASIVDGNSAKSDDPDFSDCVADVTASISVVDSCGSMASTAGLTVIWNFEGASGYGTSVDLTGLTAGEYEVVWTAQDNCGNVGTAKQTITVADTKNPTPVCLQDISTATMNVDGSSVAIWASDYDLGSFDNCSEVEVYFKDEEGNAVSSRSFSCDDIANGISATQELQLYVADESGNEDFCYVTLRIDDNADICPDVVGEAALIAGEVRTELGDMVESAKVSLNKSNTDITSVEGKYAFANTPMYNAYEVTSKKDDDYLNGVTTLDLVLIQKHVLGIEALDSPYKVIAADINSDAKISGADLVDLRKLILGVYTELPSNDSWRFVDAAQSFDDVANPFPFTEALTVNLDAEALNQDFIAAKIGDVSGNAIANSLIAAGTRSAGTLNLEISDAAVAAGNTVSVAVTAANFSEIAAYQFTMDVAGLEFTGVEAGAINVSADNFAALDANTVTTAWFNAEAVSTSDVLFTMNFTATADVNLSEALAVSSRVTQAAAYNANAEKLDINVAYNGVAASEFALYQNEPNPFDQTTTVAFELAQAGAATLTVFDVTGKTVSVVKGDFNKGYNTITLDKSDLNASGVLYYQLESGSFTATKKMVVIE